MRFNRTKEHYQKHSEDKQKPKPSFEEHKKLYEDTEMQEIMSSIQIGTPQEIKKILRPGVFAYFDRGKIEDKLLKYVDETGDTDVHEVFRLVSDDLRKEEEEKGGACRYI